MGNYIDWKKKSYCVYLYLDEEGRPYYVGMGSLRRPYVKKRWAPRPADKEKILVAPAESREAAVRMELLLIRHWGRQDRGGMLMNRTKGGAGLREPSAEAKEKIRASTTGRQRTPEWTRNQIASNEWRVKRENWIGPDGQIIFTYPAEIVRDYPGQKLCLRSLGRVKSGRLNNHKGWAPLRRVIQGEVSKTKYQRRIWRHPDHGEVTAYTQELAERYGLQRGKLSMVARGQRKHHGGWEFVAVAVPPTLLSVA